MKLSAHSRREAEAMALPEAPHLVVSISTPHEPPANIVPGVSTLGVLKLQFYDMDRIIEGYNDILKDGMFNAEQARLILDFVAAHPGAQQVIVHCDGGLSRERGSRRGAGPHRQWRRLRALSEALRPQPARLPDDP